jgi:hypothetical protein
MRLVCYIVTIFTVIPRISGLRAGEFLPSQIVSYDVDSLQCAVWSGTSTKAEPTPIVRGVTIGKMLHFASITKLQNMLLGGGSLEMEFVPKGKLLWSALSACNHDSAWKCLYGDSLREAKCETQHLELTNLPEGHAEVLMAGTIASLLAPAIYNNPRVFTKRDAVMRLDSTFKISLHARFGDACDSPPRPRAHYRTNGALWEGNRRPCFAHKAYLEAVRTLAAAYQAGIVLLATDSDAFLDVALKELPNYQVHYVNASRKDYDYGKGWIENRKDLNAHMVDTSLADLHLLSGGMLWLAVSLVILQDRHTCSLPAAQAACRRTLASMEVGC